MEDGPDSGLVSRFPSGSRELAEPLRRPFEIGYIGPHNVYGLVDFDLDRDVDT